MATNFGFYPATSGEHYFISYNTEDTERVKPIAYTLYKSGVPLWYDFGLEYGEEWERQIAANIRGAKAVIMFITSGIFRKERSYVRKEFDIARMYRIKIVPVILDEIDTYTVPTQYAGWWVDVAALQGVNGGGNDSAVLARQIMYALGYKGKPAAQQAAPRITPQPAPQPARQPLRISVGSRVQFGRYPQSGDTPEPITWRVLDIINGKALMISEKLLDAHRFDAKRNNWQSSELRVWLNNDFLNRAFSAYEQRQLGDMNGDRVICLSMEETEKYFSGINDRSAALTAYAIKRDARIKDEYTLANGEKSGWWWLRSPGSFGISAAIVGAYGSINDVGLLVSDEDICVRPVILASL